MFKSRLSDVRAEEVDALWHRNQPEGLELDFKEDFDGLPSSDRARDDIAKEMIAFANAYGGTLIVGIVDEDDRAVGARYVPECLAVARSLDDFLRSDVIEPRLPSGFECVGVPASPDGSGYVVLRVPASLQGPHWIVRGRGIEKGGMCFVRRNLSAQTANMKEIHDLVLDRYRRLGRLDEIRELADERMDRLIGRYLRHWPENPDAGNAFVMRVLALPTSPLSLEMAEIEGAPHAFANEVFIHLNNRIERAEAVIADGPWRPKLRGFSSEFADRDNLLVVEKGCDGSISILWHYRAGQQIENAKAMGISMDRHVYANWLHVVIARALRTVEAFRDHTGIGPMEYSLESRLSVGGAWRVYGVHPTGVPLLPYDEPMEFPPYIVGPVGRFQSIVATFANDLANLVGISAAPVAEFAWDRL